MKLFADLLRRLWQADLPAAKRQQPLRGDRSDHSSMAEFVRILQEEDRVSLKEDA